MVKFIKMKEWNWEQSMIFTHFRNLSGGQMIRSQNGTVTRILTEMELRFQGVTPLTGIEKWKQA